MKKTLFCRYLGDSILGPWDSGGPGSFLSNPGWGRRSWGELHVLPDLESSHGGLTPVRVQLFLTWSTGENKTWKFVMFSFVISTRDCSRFCFFHPKEVLSIWKERESMSQCLLHKYDAYFPFSIHNQRIIFSSIIINLFQILPMVGNGLRKKALGTTEKLFLLGC